MPSTSPGRQREVHAAHGVDDAVLRREVDLETIDLQGGLGHQALTWLFLGSKASRRPSPIRKIDRIRMMRKTTGKTKSHHSVVAESWPWSTSSPSETAGGWTPSPRKDSVDSKMMLRATVSVALTMMGPDGVGQHVLDDDAPVGRAERPGRLDEVALAQREEVGPHEPGDVGPRQACR